VTSIQANRPSEKGIGEKATPRLPLTLLPALLDPGLLLAGLLALFVIHPLLQPGLPGTADTPIHFYRTLEFGRSWGPGVIYPRWAPDLAYGYGYPLWDFAPPLPYLIPLALRAVGLSLEASLKGLVALTALGYALGAYLLGRAWLGPRAGLVAAAVYTLAPFALREVLLYGGNYPQYLAIGLYPWVLWALGRVHSRRGGWLNVLLVAAFYGAVILSHLFHALVLTPVAAAYAGLLWLSDRRDFRRLAESALAVGLGLLWTAFLWLPAFFERTFTRATEDVYVSVSPFHLRFLNWGELLAGPQALDARAANPWVPFSLGPAALVLAGLGLLAFLLARRRVSVAASQRISQSATWQGWFFLGLLAITVFMMLPISNWVWANVPFLASAEFPWRLLGLANLSLAFLAGASVHLAPTRRQTLFAFTGVLAVLLGSAVYLYPSRPFVHYGETVADMSSYEKVTRTIGTTTLGEYLPQWVTSVPADSPLTETLTRGETVEKLDRASLPAGAAARLLDHTAVSDGYHLDSPQPFTARFLTYYFPGWTAHLDGQPVDIIIEPGSGFISVPVPAGSHELQLRFGDTRLRTVSNTITGFALVALVVAAVRGTVLSVRHRKRGVLPESIRHITFGPGWLLVGGGLVGLLLIKGLVVDPQTGWFRRLSPPGQVIGAQHPLHVNLDDRFWLLGYDLDQGVVAQGGWLRVVVYWQAQQPLVTDYRSFVHLDAPTDQRTWAGSDNFHPGDATAQIDIPTSTWDTTHYIRDEHFLRVPPEVPPVTFNLRAGLYDPDTGRRISIAGDESDTITLQAVQVAPGRGLRRADLPHPVDYRLGEQIRLLGYDWDPEGTTLTLYWQSDRSPEANYVVFVHLLDEGGSLAWGADSPPLNGLYPTSAWQPGLIVADPRPLAPADMPPGEYTLAVGMYHPANMARLPVTDAYGKPVVDNAIRLIRLTLP